MGQANPGGAKACLEASLNRLGGRQSHGRRTWLSTPQVDQLGKSGGTCSAGSPRFATLDRVDVLGRTARRPGGGLSAGPTRS